MFSFLFWPNLGRLNVSHNTLPTEVNISSLFYSLEIFLASFMCTFWGPPLLTLTCTTYEGIIHLSMKKGIMSEMYLTYAEYAE